MRPRRKRPQPAMSDKAFEKRVAEMKARGIRILLLLEAQGSTIDWSEIEGGRPANADKLLLKKPKEVTRVHSP